MDILIQPAAPEQADAMTQIAVAAKRHWGYPERWVQIWLPALTISGDYIAEHETWVALAEDANAAWYSLKEAEDGLWLDNLWVLPAFIGRGVGRRLFRHAMERSRMRGASVLMIESDPNAEGFYFHMGARRVGERVGELDSMPRRLPIMEIRVKTP